MTEPPTIPIQCGRCQGTGSIDVPFYELGGVYVDRFGGQWRYVDVGGERWERLTSGPGYHFPPTEVLLLQSAEVAK